MQTAVLVGCGAMSEGWLRAIAHVNSKGEKVRLVGFVDLDADLAAKRAEAWGWTDAKAGSDLAAMLEETKPDVVFDIVVPVARSTVVTTAFDHGCDVLSEKPMANTLEEAKALLTARKASNRLHAVIQNRRYLDGIRRAKSFLESGAIGEVAEVHCDFFIAPHFGGFREEMQHVLLLDMAIHTFDAARFVSGIEPRRVVCVETNPDHSWYSHGASANAIFECENNKLLTYRGSWCAEGAPTDWEATWRIVGSKGTLIWDGNNGFRAERPASRDGLLAEMEEIEVPDLPPLENTGHAGVIADFLAARDSGAAPLTDSRDNYRSLAMTFDAIESAVRGSFIDIEEE